MSYDDKCGGPAFPTTAGNTVYSHGMYLRDWFAGQAPFTFADACAWLGYIDTFEAMNTPSQRDEVIRAMAMLRFNYADAMIAERTK